MCGRFTLRTPLNLLAEYFLFSHSPDISLPPKYNIAPTHSIATLTARNGQRELQRMHWGLIPGWSKDLSRSGQMINARSETIHEKPSFRSAFEKRRCLILADGYFEWKSDSSGKQPYFIHSTDQQPFAFAGLWEAWYPPPDANSPENSEPWLSTTIITTAANKITNQIHHRMPVILSPDHYDQWLQNEPADPQRLHALLVNPVGDNQMGSFRMTAVSKRVNRVANDDPDCIKPIATEQELF